MKRTAFSLLPLLGLSVLLVSCAGYRLGSMLPKDIQTVFLPTVVNSSQEPNLESEVTQAMVVRLQQDGSLRVVNDEAIADSILNIEIFDYRLAPLNFDTELVNQAEEYRITLLAKVLLVRNGTGEVVAENPRVRGKTEFPFTGDLTSSKRSYLPDASRDLAQNIVDILVEAW